MPSQVSFIIFETVALPTLNKNDKDCCESPDAKYLRVIVRRSAAKIPSLALQCLFEMKGDTKYKRCSKLSGDIRKNLNRERKPMYSIFVFLN